MSPRVALEDDTTIGDHEQPDNVHLLHEVVDGLPRALVLVAERREVTRRLGQWIDRAAGANGVDRRQLLDVGVGHTLFLPAEQQQRGRFLFQTLKDGCITGLTGGVWSRSGCRLSGE